MSDSEHSERTLNKVEERLRALELQQQRTTAHLESEVGNLVRLMSEIRDIIKRHDTMFFGNNGSVGLMTRIDRLEQSEKSRKWAMHAIGATALSLLIKVLWDIVLHH